MPVVQLTVTIKIDGELAEGFPLVRRLTSPTQVAQIDDTLAAAAVVEVTNIGYLTGPTVIALLPDGAVSLNREYSATLVPLEKGGLFLAFGKAVSDYHALTNTEDDPIRVRGVIAGTT